MKEPIISAKKNTAFANLILYEGFITLKAHI